MIETSLNFVCPGCLTVNRVPQSRLCEHPVCGKCRQSLIPEQPVELNDDSFRKYISRTDVPVIVDFWASWCPPCRMMAPAFAEAARELQPEFVLAKVSTEESPVTAGGFNIQGIPCLIAFQHGVEVGRQAGAMQAEQIVAWIRSQNWKSTV
jgi:thioredoxin 2